MQYGDPLVLGVRERDVPINKLLKKQQPGFSDISVTWEHSSPGVVTDVIKTKKGWSVAVKAYSPAQVGDKMSGRFGDKGVIGMIVPDSQMYHDKDGKPFDLLVPSVVIPTRMNPAQLSEAILGRIAAKTGKAIAVPGFKSDKKMSDFVMQQLKEIMLEEYEDAIDPVSGQKIEAYNNETAKQKPLVTGRRYFMKLHHTAEGKEQAREGGAYTIDVTPAKGGASGCFIAGTPIETTDGPTSIEASMGLELAPGNVVKNVFERKIFASDRLLEITLENGECRWLNPLVVPDQ
ncbi:MAG: hypothetical protein R3B84_20830 [Zavarzinella sp.]